MFTGIVEETGKLVSISRTGESAKIKVGCSVVLEGSKLGDSIAVNGVCLTVTAMGHDSFDADISYETLARTSLKTAVPGTVVNLERALTLSSRLGGHLVQGHVDGLASVASISRRGESWTLKINYPESIDRYITEKCSVCLDGISLTATNVVNCSLEVAVIPHTFDSTNLKYRNPGDKINIEADQIARYTEKLLKNDNKEERLGFLLKNMC